MAGRPLFFDGADTENFEVSSFPRFVDNELTYFQPEPDSDN